MVDLIRTFAPDQYTRALESWDWLAIGARSPVCTSPFGDVFFRADDGFWWLDTLEARLTREWATAEEMYGALSTPEGQDRFLLAGLAASAERQGITPVGAQVYGFTVAPILGGELSVSNIQAIDFVVSINILGQLHRQVRDLPPANRISEFRFES